MRIKVLIYSIIVFVLLTSLYIIVGIGLSYLPIKRSNQNNGSIKIFVISNGFHTDFLVPIDSKQINWIKKIGNPNLEKFQKYSYVSFGWGDRDFYLDSFTSDYPSILSILRALFIPTETLMHVDFWKAVNIRKDYIIELNISEEQYRELVNYIVDTIEWDNSGKAQVFLEYGYENTDLFLVANGYYHLFKTCNNWTNIGLQKMNVTTPIWCPFTYCILKPLAE